MQFFLFLATAMISSTSFAQNTKAPAGKTLKSTDGTYELEVAEGVVHRCGKDNFFMDYISYDSKTTGCMVTYKKLKCAVKDNPCPVDKWEVLQEEKVIASAKNSNQFCKEKITQLTEKFKTQGFDCKIEGAE